MTLRTEKHVSRQTATEIITPVPPHSPPGTGPSSVMGSPPLKAQAPGSERKPATMKIIDL